MDELSAVLLALYGAARKVVMGEFQDAALALIYPLIAFSSAAWGTARIRDDGVVLHSVHLSGDPPDRLIDYEEVKSQDTAAFLVRQNPGRALIFHAPTLYRDSQHSGIREYAKRWKHQNYILASRPTDSGLLAWIGVYRGASDDHYSEADRKTLQLLLPHLHEALDINRLVNLEQAHSPCPRGTAIADRFGVLYHADFRFLELIRREWRECSGARLPQPLAEHLGRAPGSRYGGRSVVVCARQVRDLVFLNAREKAPIDALTPRELSVAAHVAEGLHHKEIARRLGISPATVRNYTQAIHERLGVRTNAEVAAQLRASHL